MNYLSTIAVTAITLFFSTITSQSAAPASAKEPRKLAVEMGAPFHDHAILQRGMKVPVWGWSKPETKVMVTFAGQSKNAIAGKDGKWTLELDPLKANAESVEMVIMEAGGKTETLKDILVGEVWLASGQSNMQYPVQSQGVRNMPREIQARVQAGEETMPIIREALIPGWGATLEPVEKASAVWGTDWNAMSAIAFSFSYELATELKIPIGIVNCSFSQTPIEGWAHRDGFKGGDDEFTKEIYQSILDKDPSNPGFKAQWDAYGKAVSEWAKEADERAGKGLSPNPMPETPGSFRFGNRGATWLYNAKTHPMAPYAIRGVIWNQGYHNGNDGIVYRNNLHSLVRSFRSVWDKPELPVYFHQFYCPNNTYSEGVSFNAMAEMRLGTWLAHKDIPNAAMASQIDIFGGTHYQEKRVPAQRLALHALKNQYPSTKLTAEWLKANSASGKAKDLVANGPMYKGYTVKGGTLILELDHAKGLRTGKYGGGEVTEDDIELFFLADGDLKWHQAEVKIKRDTIELTAPGLPKPRGVAYGCNGVGMSLPNIYNGAGLPLTPFIYYDHKLVVSPQWDWEHVKIPSKPLDVMVWPMAYLARGDIKVDITTYGIGMVYRKLPLLASQFRDGGVLQADVPIRVYGEAVPNSVVKVTFAGQEQTIEIGADQTDWEATFPARKASDKPLSIMATAHLDGQLIHERGASNIVIGDVWYVAVNNATMPGIPWNQAYEPPTGPIRMLQSESKKSSDAMPNRFKLATGSRIGRYYARWQTPQGLAKELGDRIHAKTGNPVGVMVINTRGSVSLKDYVGYQWLDKVEAWKADQKDLYGRYNPDTTFYKTNVDAYMKTWQDFWKRVAEQPGFAQDNASGGIPSFPRPPAAGSSSATTRYNWAITNFSPAAFKGIICLTPETFIGEDEGAGFGEQFSVMANCWKETFAYGKKAIDPHFVYTVPSKELAPKITAPVGIEGASTAVEMTVWPEINQRDPDNNNQLIISNEIKAVLDTGVKATYK